MNNEHLSAHHRTTLAQIFSHPVAHNVEWAPVASLIESIGAVIDRHNGEYAFDVGSQRAFFRKPNGKDFETEDILRLRTFLQKAGVSADAVPATPATAPSAATETFVVVADHHDARVYAFDDASGTLVERNHITPDDRGGFERHLTHKKEAHYQGERVPEDRPYYNDVNNALAGSANILLIGDATGKSSAIGYFSEHLAREHAETFRRVVGTIDADLSALTDGKIATLSRDFLAKTES